MNGGRILRIREHIGDENFLMTDSDGVGDVNIDELLEFHPNQGWLSTLAVVYSPRRFGEFQLMKYENVIPSSKVKPDGDGAWINGGFFVLESGVMDYIDGDHIDWEKEPVERLASSGKLAAYKHHGLWQPMDTFHDKGVLEQFRASNTTPWKIW